MRLWQLCLLFFAAFLGFVVWSFPLEAALRYSGATSRGLTYDAAEGTIWQGRLTNAYAGTVHLGAVDFSVRGFDLLRGRLSIRWAARGRALRGGGMVSAMPGGTLALQDLAVQSDLSEMPTFVSMAGAFDLEIEEADFGPGGCTTASGEIRTAARIVYAQESWRAPELKGAPRCENGHLIVLLEGEDQGGDAASIHVRIAPDLFYEAQLVVRTGDERLANSMLTIGFDETDHGYEFVQAGRWAPRPRQP